MSIDGQQAFRLSSVMVKWQLNISAWQIESCLSTAHMKHFSNWFSVTERPFGSTLPLSLLRETRQIIWPKTIHNNRVRHANLLHFSVIIAMFTMIDKMASKKPHCPSMFEFFSSWKTIQPILYQTKELVNKYSFIYMYNTVLYFK